MMENTEVAISVIMPNLNGVRYLTRSIEAFLRQSHKNKELLIVDDRSTDGSHDVIAKFCSENSSIKWLRYQDRGISDATNFAIQRARGEVIGYIGNDDVLLNGALGRVAELASYVDFDVVYFKSFAYFVQERKWVVNRPKAEITIENLLKHCTIVGGQNTYYRRRIFESLQFNPDNKYSMDYELLLELAKRKAFFVYADELCTLNYVDGNISHNNPLQSKEAMAVTLRFAEGFAGPLWCEPMLPSGERTRRAARRFRDNLRRVGRRLRRSLARG